LFVLVKGMAFALKSLFYMLLLLFVLTYTVAIVFRYLADYSEELTKWKYNSVGGAFWNLLIYGTFLDAVRDMFDGLRIAGAGYAMLFLGYIFVSNLTMLNMLIGVLCEVIQKVTEAQDASDKKRDLQESLYEILQMYDREGKGRLRIKDFDALMKYPDLKLVLKDHDVALSDVENLKEVLFLPKRTPNGTIVYSEATFPTFIGKVLKLRGGNAVQVSDVAEMREWLARQFSDVKKLGSGIPLSPSDAGDQDSEASDISDEAPCELQPPQKQAEVRDPGNAGGGGKQPQLLKPAPAPPQIAPAGASYSDFETALLAQIGGIEAGQRATEQRLVQMKETIRGLEEQMLMLTASSPS